MTFEECTKEDLRTFLQNNNESQTEIAQKLRQIDVCEEETLTWLTTDSKAVELLYDGWTGEAAKKYIIRAQDDNEQFRKRYLDAFAQEREKIYEEQKRLQSEEQDIFAAMAKRSNQEKE